jgi:pimeloyl-ACP methyl ester carboxylesterase
VNLSRFVFFATFVATISVHAHAGQNTASTEIGAQAGAAYRIDIPPNWNHELVVYYHGYSTTPVLFEKGEPLSPMFDPLLAKGYALIQSGYSSGGWAIEQAFPETEKLRQAFVAKHGAPKRNYVMGMSMGGALTALTIEQRAEVYNGALSLCGAIEPSSRFMQRDFALRAAFDYYFPDLLGPLVPVPAEFQLDEQNETKIARALAGNPTATRALLGLYGAADSRNLAPVLGFIAYEVKEMQQRAHGNPFGNADMIYVGSGDDFALNDGVKRYRTESKAAAYLARWYTPTGKLLRPFLALHDTGDPLVPAATAFEYALIVERAGHADNFVQQYVNREGHCVFTPDEIGHAFDELVDWANTGKRPESGKLN